MRTEIETVFTHLPFDNHIKYNIYTQLYKTHYTIQKDLKCDLLSYMKIYDIVSQYKKHYGYKYEMMLLNDLYGYMFHVMRSSVKMITMKSLVSSQYLEVLNVNHRFMSEKYYIMRIRKIWNIMSPYDRANFSQHIKLN